MPKEMYKCEICGRIYSNRKDAAECETLNHDAIKECNYIYNNEYCKIPSEIELKFFDGLSVYYERQ